MQKAITRSKSSARDKLYPAEERSLSASSLDNSNARHKAITVLLAGMYFLFDRILENNRRSIMAFFIDIAVFLSGTVYKGKHLLRESILPVLL